MIILGIDPGSIVTGYGVVDYESRQIKLITSGVIRTPAKTNFPERLKIIYDGINQVLNDFRPQIVSIEDVFYARNVQSVLKLGQTRGVVLLAVVNHEIPIVEYAPRTIKLAVTGNGAASKEQVNLAVSRILNLQNDSASFDISDALAVAICHCHRIIK